MARKLILHAGDPAHRPPDVHALAATLADIGLIATPLPGLPDAWYAGDAFLSHVIFLGCSPQVEFEPGDPQQAAAGHFCHVRYQRQDAGPVFRSSAGRLQPRCPGCRGRLEQWQELVRDWPSDREATVPCAGCGRTLQAPELDWRQCAGFGRWFLEIWNIHPHEAVPTEALITRLEQVAGTPVRYFYE
ncbi:MAG TPA: hypothetical protein VIQ75_07080 [Gammaproteobacteria bacterium]